MKQRANIVNFDPDKDTPNPLWDFSKMEAVESFAEHLMMVTSNDFDTISGLTLFLLELEKKQNIVSVQDLCDHLKRELFKNTMEFDEAQNAWETRVRMGWQMRD